MKEAHGLLREGKIEKATPLLLFTTPIPLSKATGTQAPRFKAYLKAVRRAFRGAHQQQPGF